MGFEQYFFQGRIAPELPFNQRGPWTLHYPEPTKSDRDDYRKLLSSKEELTYSDIIVWGQLRLYLIKPDWLFNYREKQQRAKVAGRVTSEFSEKLVKGFHLIALFQETPVLQESLFLSAVALLSHGHPELSERLKKQVVRSPSAWAPVIKMSDWLYEELQIEVDGGPACDFLEEIRQLQFQEKVPLEEQVDLWLSKFIGSVSANLPKK